MQRNYLVSFNFNDRRGFLYRPEHSIHQFDFSARGWVGGRKKGEGPYLVTGELRGFVTRELRGLGPEVDIKIKTLAEYSISLQRGGIQGDIRWTLRGDDTVELLDLSTGSTLIFDPLPRRALRDAFVHVATKRIAAITFNEIAIYSYNDGRLRKEFGRKFDTLLRGVHLSENRVVLESSRLHCYEFLDNKLRETWSCDFRQKRSLYTAARPFLLSHGNFNTVSRRPILSNSEIVFLGPGKKMVSFALLDGKLSRLKGHRKSVTFAAFSPNGQTLVTADHKHVLVRERGANGFNTPIVDA